MDSAIHDTRPLAPLVPLGGFALRPLPPVLLQPVLAAAMVVMRRRHPDVFERLTSLGDAAFLIDPTDLPFRFVLELGARGPSLAALRRRDGPPPVRATIHGPLLMLVDLLEGRIDGDAVFFARGLTVEGDMEAVVALRNAVDSAEIELAEDVFALLGPLAVPARRLMPVAGAVAERAAREVDTLRDILTTPLRERIDTLEAEVTALRRRAASGAKESR